MSEQNEMTEAMTKILSKGIRLGLLYAAQYLTKNQHGVYYNSRVIEQNLLDCAEHVDTLFIGSIEKTVEGI